MKIRMIFLSYLLRIGYSVTRDSFVPRRLFGDYLVDRYERYSGLASSVGINVRHISASCRSLTIRSHRNYQLALDNGKQLRVTDVMFCTGHGSPIVPRACEQYLDYPTVIPCPFPEAAMVEKLPEPCRVLIAGSKLSAIDAALILCREGHTVTMLSPSGELPAVRSRFIRSGKFAFDPKEVKHILSLWKNDDSQSDDNLLMRRYLNYTWRWLKKVTNISPSLKNSQKS
jgi:uncharacterized NAD(P)/FAD-binding protein YdhS